MRKYNKAVALACKKLDENKQDEYKAGGTYRLIKDNDTVRIYHYGMLLGGIRYKEGKKVCILGCISSLSDETALNTVWKYHLMGRRVYYKKGQTRIRLINECSDNYEVI